MIAAAVIALLQVAAVSGELPSSIEPQSITRIVWLAGDDVTALRQAECELRLPRRWSCVEQSPAHVGIVLIYTGSDIGFVALGPRGVVATGVARWGRVIRVVTDTESTEIKASALVLDRPAVRPNTRTLGVVSDSETHIWPISAAVFWAASNVRSGDAFIRFDAEGSARHDEPLERVFDAVPETPLAISLHPSLTLQGRVESSSGADVPGALVDLLTLRPDEIAEPTPGTLNAADVMQVAETRTDADGRFEFDGLESRLYKVAVADFEHGRGEQWTGVSGPPILVRLKAPSRATGRVLRQHLPVSGVVVRFVPDAIAWRDSRDPAAHLTLDASTDHDGRFTLTLPPSAQGIVQLAAADGATKRIPLPDVANASEVALGDVVLDELMPIELQTDVADCAVSAIGPAGVAGFSIVRARSVGIVHSLQLPEPGQWLMQVECGGVQRRVSPPVVDVSPKGGQSTYNLHVVD